MTLTLENLFGIAIDTSGFGAYASGGILGVYDRPEAFRDDNENGVRDGNEFFIDYNHNGTFDTADGKFNGILCSHSTLCSSSTKLIVSAQGVLVMSDSVATVTFLNASPVNVSAAPVKVSFIVADGQNQTMPKGTTISISAANGNLSGPTSYTVGNTANGPQIYSVDVAKDNTSSSGTLTVTVTVPSGRVSYGTITVND